MKIFPTLLFILSSFLFFSCSETSSEEQEKENGFHLLVKADYGDFLFQKMNPEGRSRLAGIIERSEKTVDDTGKDFWKCFEAELLMEKADNPLSLFISDATSRMRFQQMNNHEIIEELKKEFDQEFSRTMVIAEARLNQFGASYPEIRRSGANYFEITAYNIKDKERFANLIQHHAQVGFFETMNNIDALYEILRLTKVVYERDSIAGISFADSYLDGTPNSFVPRGFHFNIVMDNGQQSLPNGTQIGMAELRDTIFFNQFVKDTVLKQYLPPVVHFLWGWKADENGLLPLYTIIARNLYEPDLGSKHITATRVSNEQGQLRVYIHFDQEGAEKFRKMTKNNLNKAIGIVMDNKVLSFPTIHSEISGGSAFISGNFTVDEAEDLANVLKSGLMPLKLEVVKMEKIK